MGYSRVSRTANGASNVFVVEFALGYLGDNYEHSTVVCRVGNETLPGGAPKYRELVWIGENTVEVQGDLVAANVEVVFQRWVPKDRLVVDFQNGAQFTKSNMNTAVKQAIMVAHEALDTQAEAAIDYTNERVAAEAAVRAGADAAIVALIGTADSTANVYASRPAVALLTIADVITDIYLLGCTAAGDGGAAWYKKIASESLSDYSALQSGDGAWWVLNETNLFPEMFGAVGKFDYSDESTYVQNDSGAINFMIAYATEVLGYNPSSFSDFGNNLRATINFRGGAVYKIDATINLEWLYNASIYGNGATLWSGYNTGVVVSMFNTSDVSVYDLNIYAENPGISGWGEHAKYGLVHGRTSGTDAGGINMQNVRVDGWFWKAAVVNIASEGASYIKCYFYSSDARNGDTGGTDVECGYGFAAQVRNLWSIPNITGDANASSDSSFNELKFQDGFIGSAQGTALQLFATDGAIAGAQFQNMYMNCSASYAICDVYGLITNMIWDVHCEVSGIAVFYARDNRPTNGHVTFRGLTFRDHGLMVPYVFRRENTGGINILIFGLTARIARVISGSPRWAPANSLLECYLADIELDQASSSMCHFNGFSKIFGQLKYGGNLTTDWQSNATTGGKFSAYDTALLNGDTIP